MQTQGGRRSTAFHDITDPFSMLQNQKASVLCINFPRIWYGKGFKCNSLFRSHSEGIGTSRRWPSARGSKLSRKQAAYMQRCHSETRNQRTNAFDKSDPQSKLSLNKARKPTSLFKGSFSMSLFLTSNSENSPVSLKPTFSSFFLCKSQFSPYLFSAWVYSSSILTFFH